MPSFEIDISIRFYFSFLCELITKTAVLFCYAPEICRENRRLNIILTSNTVNADNDIVIINNIYFRLLTDTSYWLIISAAGRFD